MIQLKANPDPLQMSEQKFIKRKRAEGISSRKRPGRSSLRMASLSGCVVELPKLYN